MDASNRDALSAVVARQRGRGRLRSATIALGAASLVTAGAIAYTLPSGVAHTTTTTATAGTAAAAGSSTAVHATSGGSGVAATTTSSGTGTASAPAASSGTSHATSGGS
jgi:hypothetical protein